jgi:hypothetical protein
MKMDRDSFKATRDIVAYIEQEEGYAEESYPVRAGTAIFVASAADKTRTLDGKSVRAVLFTIDTSGWYWMPRSEFLRSTEKVDVTPQSER